jgi:aerobic carbon-monoxide dehydrogenase medium subunit
MTPFHKPKTLKEALALLSDIEDARALSGGQTLVPMMNLGIAQPTAIVSLNAIDELRGMQRQADGSVRIGALCRHAEVAQSHLLIDGQQLLKLAPMQIGNVAVRLCGTIGGACAHGDPSTNWPVALVTAEARIEIAGPRGSRLMPAADFFRDFLVTALDPGEIVRAIVVPPLPGRAAYRKLVRVASGGSVLTVGAISETSGGRFRSLRVGIGAVGPRPVRAPAVEQEMAGATVDLGNVDRFARALAARSSPSSDINGSADYKLAILPRIVSGVIMESVGA